MPIYEYRCPQGHTFEQFRRMADAPPEACEVCGQGPLDIVLYPVAVHYKGSGFYSTDYGKGSGKRPKDGDKSSSDSGSGGGDSKSSESSSGSSSSGSDSGSGSGSGTGSKAASAD
jgi:putative FmdB family regulatory protein